MSECILVGPTRFWLRVKKLALRLRWRGGGGGDFDGWSDGGNGGGGHVASHFLGGETKRPNCPRPGLRLGWTCFSLFMRRLFIFLRL